MKPFRAPPAPTTVEEIKPGMVFGHPRFISNYITVLRIEEGIALVDRETCFTTGTERMPAAEIISEGYHYCSDATAKTMQSYEQGPKRREAR